MYKKRILIPKFNFGGHYLEYLTHIYTYAKQDSLNNYVFALSEEYKNHFCTEKNIIVVFMSEDSLKYYRKAKGIYMRDLFENILIRQLVKKYNPTDVIHITLIDIIRFLPVFVIKGVNYSGILYYVYLYNWKYLSIFRKCQEAFMCRMLAHCQEVKAVFVCNDEFAGRLMNRIHKTTKFIHIPDPYVPIEKDIEQIEELNEYKDKDIYIHFGALGKNKGTIEILKAIEILDNEVSKRCVFVFAGRVNPIIKTEFDERIKTCREKTTIIVHDEFCSFVYLAYICSKANYILMPYQRTFQSSGLFGYASQYGVPVVGSGKCLHGRLIRKYRLGFTLEDVNYIEIARFISESPKKKYKASDNYLYYNNPQNFCLTLLEHN